MVLDSVATHGRQRSNTWTNGWHDRTRAIKTLRNQQRQEKYTSLFAFEEEYFTLSQLELEAGQLIHRIHQLGINLIRLEEDLTTFDSLYGEFDSFKKTYQSYFDWRLKHPPKAGRTNHLIIRRYQAVAYHGLPDADRLKRRLRGLSSRIEQFQNNCTKVNRSFRELSSKITDLFGKACQSLEEEELNRFVHHHNSLERYSKALYRLSESGSLHSQVKQLQAQISQYMSFCDPDCIRFYREGRDQELNNTAILNRLTPHFRSVIGQTAALQSTCNYSAPAC